MSDDARAQLAVEQARLVRALGGRADAPAGFDAGRVDLAARTLLSKRRKGVLRAWPMLAGALGGRFADEFDAFARASSPSPDGPAADGFAFARWLDAQGLLPPAAAREFIAQRLWRGRRIGLTARRGEDRRLLVGIRLPLIGVRLLAVLSPRRGAGVPPAS